MSRPSTIVEPRYPLAPLLALSRVAEERLRVLHDTGTATTPMGVVARLAGVDRTLLHRWDRQGGLTWDVADRAACALGALPWVVWPDWILWPAERARLAKNESARRRRAARPDIREADNARRRAARKSDEDRATSRQWRLDHYEYALEDRRRRYQTNRDRELDRQRAYDRARAAQRREAS